MDAIIGTLLLMRIVAALEEIPQVGREQKTHYEDINAPLRQRPTVLSTTGGHFWSASEIAERLWTNTATYCVYSEGQGNYRSVPLEKSH